MLRPDFQRAGYIIYSNATVKGAAMTQDVYADLLFLINFSMDYLCLYICAKVMRRKMRLPRMLIASALGGIYSVLALFLPTNSAISLIIDALVCVIICAIALSEESRRASSTLLCSFLFVGISMMMGGCMTAISNLLNRLELPLGDVESDGISTYLFAILAAAAGIISLRSGEIVSRRAAVKDCTLTVTLSGKSITLSALVDTGNLVTDPLSGKSVVIIDRERLAPLVDPSLLDAFISGDTNCEGAPRGMRIIPINTAGGRALLCALPPDGIAATVTTKKGKSLNLELDALIAPSSLKVSAAGHGAIVPSDILKIEQ